jgi:hypothetical protein
VLALLLLAAVADPRTLLERAIAVEKEALPERSRYFAREDVRVTRIEGERRKQLAWNTFEAMMVDGRVRYRQVARNGKPLKPQQQKLQPESKRFGLKLTQVLEHHDLELVGRETLEGRPAWHLRTHLRPAAPAPGGMEDLALLGPLDLWIDEATGQERRLRLVVEKPRGPWTLGTTLDANGTRIDRVFVAGHALVRRPVGKAIIETEQTYTGYKRFSSEAVVTFAPATP